MSRKGERLLVLCLDGPSAWVWKTKAAVVWPSRTDGDSADSADLRVVARYIDDAALRAAASEKHIYGQAEIIVGPKSARRMKVTNRHTHGEILLRSGCGEVTPRNDCRA